MRAENRKEGGVRDTNELVQLQFPAREAGVVHIAKYCGNLGNQLFQYCFARILAEERNLRLSTPPIPDFGIKDTLVDLSKKVPTIAIDDKTINNFDSHKVLISDPTGFGSSCQDYLHPNAPDANYLIHGHFEDWRLFVPYRDRIKSWFPQVQVSNYRDLVVCVRLGIFEELGLVVPASWYLDVLKSLTFGKLYICTDNPAHKYFDSFSQYSPIFVHRSENRENVPDDRLFDFNFMRLFDRIVFGNSTFPWWAAFLSDASNVYLFKDWWKVDNKEKRATNRNLGEAPVAGWIAC